MIISKRLASLQSALRNNPAPVVGFVPTMGALHQGHLALVDQAKSESDLVVCSIFVNPTQFNNPGDFAKYPVTLEKDIQLLERAGVDLLFLPSVQEVYPNGTENLEVYDLGYLETIMEGAFRPGHFQGVCRVMSRLIRMVVPQKLFMGQKDYQQCLVVRRLLQLMNENVTFVTCPTIRENDGLAMSSRNLRLSMEERQNATGIYKALTHLRSNSNSANLQQLKKEAQRILQQHQLKPDYIEIASADNLTIMHEFDHREKAVALIAAFMNEIRLIDNMVL